MMAVRLSLAQSRQGEGLPMKHGINLMNPMQRDVLRLQAARRCSATSKRTRCACQAPAVKGWAVCRFHGAGGGAPKGERNGRYVHGGRSHEAIDMRRHVTDLLRTANELVVSMTANGKPRP